MFGRSTRLHGRPASPALKPFRSVTVGVHPWSSVCQVEPSSGRGLRVRSSNWETVWSLGVPWPAGKGWTNGFSASPEPAPTDQWSLGVPLFRMCRHVASVILLVRSPRPLVALRAH